MSSFYYLQANANARFPHSPFIITIYSLNSLVLYHLYIKSPEKSKVLSFPDGEQQKNIMMTFKAYF